MTEPQDVECAEGSVRLGPDEERPQQRLLTGCLHKTSNALCGIKGYASLIAGLGQDAGDNARWAERIIREVEKMERLFSSVAEMGCATRPTLAAEDPRLMIRVAIGEACSRHRGLRVEADPMPGGRVLLPAADLGAVLRDLLDNAAEGPAGQAREVVATLAWSRGRVGRLVLVLRDNAGGLPAELGTQVRDPFVSGKKGHVGIGLTRVETIMDLHGLDWSLESEPGLGTTVKLEIAVAAREPSAMAGKA